MKKTMLAANWKMNQSCESMTNYFAELKKLTDLEQASKCLDLIFAVPFTLLPQSKNVCSDLPLSLAAQNVHWEASGAYTGEISAAMIAECGVTHCIIGHSERRQYFNESNEQISKKIAACLSAGIKPIFCIGETLAQREAGATEETITNQINSVLAQFNHDQITEMVFAYEPVWAIGTGLAATVEQAVEVHAHIRKLIESNANASIAESAIILYGGSVKASNIASLVREKHIDGGLVGGASLNADSFSNMIAEAIKVSKINL